MQTVHVSSDIASAGVSKQESIRCYSPHTKQTPHVGLCPSESVYQRWGLFLWGAIVAGAGVFLECLAAGIL